MFNEEKYVKGIINRTKYPALAVFVFSGGFIVFALICRFLGIDKYASMGLFKFCLIMAPLSLLIFIIVNIVSTVVIRRIRNRK